MFWDFYFFSALLLVKYMGVLMGSGLFIHQTNTSLPGWTLKAHGHAVCDLYQQAAVCLGFKESQDEKAGNSYVEHISVVKSLTKLDLMGRVIGLKNHLSESKRNHTVGGYPFYFSSSKILHSPLIVDQVVWVMTESLYRCDLLSRNMLLSKYALHFSQCLFRNSVSESENNVVAHPFCQNISQSSYKLYSLPSG